MSKHSRNFPAAGYEKSLTPARIPPAGNVSRGWLNGAAAFSVEVKSESALHRADDGGAVHGRPDGREQQTPRANVPSQVVI